MDKDPFSYLEFAQNTDGAMRGTIASAYQLLMAVGVVGLIVTFVIIGVTLAASGPAKRAEALQEMKWKVILAVILFSMTTVLSWVLRIAGTFAA